jgi:hypothetical protein
VIKREANMKIKISKAEVIIKNTLDNDINEKMKIRRKVME